MDRRRLGLLALGLLLAGPSAYAQGFPGGGSPGGGSRGGGGRGGRGGGGAGGSPSGDRPPPPPDAKQVAANQIDIVGVVKQIGADDRITIDYEETPALDLPAGSRSFIVAKTSLLKDVTVGERVRFRLDSQQVSALAAFDGDRSQLSDGLDTRSEGARGRSGRVGRGPGPGDAGRGSSSGSGAGPQ